MQKFAVDNNEICKAILDGEYFLSATDIERIENIIAIITKKLNKLKVIEFIANNQPSTFSFTLLQN